MIAFAKRNLLVFFKDRATVFFSLLAVFIIIGLYALFLGDVMISGMDMPSARWMMDSWIMAGLLAVTPMTTTMGAFGRLVEDRSRGIEKDFATSPLPRRSRVGGYVLSALTVGTALSLCAMALAEGYILANGGQPMGWATLGKALGLVLLTTLANTSMVLFMVSFFRSASAFTAASTVLGTMIGFLTGIYLPVGQLPPAVQWVVKCFPVSHAAMLFRQVLMAQPMDAAFAGAPETAASAFREEMGVVFRFGDTVLPPMAGIGVLLGTAAVFYLLALWNLGRKRTR